MPSTYEFWLTNDSGKRIMLLQNWAFFSYSRSISGYGTIEIGLPYKPFAESVHPVFQVDRRIDVWRSPENGYSMRREQTYILRMYKIYTREDGVQLIVFYGRDPKDLLHRRTIIQASGTQWTRKFDFIDDMMKDIVREQMLYGSALDADGVLDPNRYFPQDEFVVQGDFSLGYQITQNFGDENVLDSLKKLREASAQSALDGTSSYKIYFDVVPFDMDDGKIGFRFETFASLRGNDRTGGVIFSQENNNLKFPYYSKSHLEEINTVIVKGFGRGDSRAHDTAQYLDNVNESRWNRVESYEDASNEPDQTNLADAGLDTLYKNRPNEELSAVFLNVPGSQDTPRSLYGIDWDMGDALPVEYAGKRFDVEVEIVYVALDENGRETITGRNSANASL